MFIIFLSKNESPLSLGMIEEIRSMEHNESYLEQQQSTAVRLIPNVFPDALGPVELQVFEKFYVEIMDAGLGWLTGMSRSLLK